MLGFAQTVTYDSEKYILLLCVWKLAFLKSSDISIISGKKAMAKNFLHLNAQIKLRFTSEKLTEIHCNEVKIWVPYSLKFW